jgi:restriction system protein
MSDIEPLDEVGEILELAVSVIDDAIADVKTAAHAALTNESLDELDAGTARLMELRAFQNEVNSLLDRWNATKPAIADEDSFTVDGDRRAYLGRVSRGSRTPEPAFRVPILSVLIEAGGSLPMRDAIDRVGELMADDLNEVDRKPLPSDERTVRWRNTAQWARNNLADEGLLDRSTRGIWAITDQGRTWMETRT